MERPAAAPGRPAASAASPAVEVHRSRRPRSRGTGAAHRPAAVGTLRAEGAPRPRRRAAALDAEGAASERRGVARRALCGDATRAPRTRRHGRRPRALTATRLRRRRRHRHPRRSRGRSRTVMSSAASSRFAFVELARRLVEPVGEDAEELPEHLHGDLVLLAEDLEEVRAADGDELRGADGGDARRARHAADERHLADVLARPEMRERSARRATRAPCPRGR